MDVRAKQRFCYLACLSYLVACYGFAPRHLNRYMLRGKIDGTHIMKRISYLPIVFALFLISASAQSNNSVTVTPNQKDFVGSYIYSSGFVGASYKITDDGKFEYSTFSDCCDPVWREIGNYALKDNQLHFKVSKKILNNYDLLDPKQMTEAYRKLYDYKGADFQIKDIETEYDMQIVRWGERIYLLEPERLHLFTAAVNFGIEPRPRIINDNFLTTRFYLRGGDENKTVSGKPSLPEPLLPFLQDSPLKATITKIESQEKEKIYTINTGSKSGIKVGMSFVGENVEPDYDNLLWVISVEENSAKVKSLPIFRAFNYELKNVLTTKTIKK